ncbi:helix-turn-helix domain-containing protein [Pseudomonas sp. NFXW11]|uniref:helix-turn-helix domain-containing protein n=1 Tax=Pseudomonas sp. NFXW11 TaxID=2819531 RepID=UPI003CFB3A16
MHSGFKLPANTREDFFIGGGRFAEPQEQPLELAYVVLLIGQRGRAELQVNLQPYRLARGDVLVLAEDSVVRVSSQSADFACHRYLLDRSMAAEVAALLPNSLFAYLHHSPLYPSSGPLRGFLRAWEAQAAMLDGQGAEYRRRMLINHLQNLFLWLCAHLDLDARAQNDCSRPEALCWKFWELIARHCRQQRDVAFYAELLHVTPYYLAQQSRKYFNDAPKTLIDRQVVLEIKKQLAQTSRSVQQIADDLHFADASYLGKYFKRLTGQGLSQYRKG